MIKNFATISNMAVFKDYNWKKSTGKEKSFGEINILYGRNYSGKTTLSRIARSFETGHLSDKYGTPKFKITLENEPPLSEADYPKKKMLIRVFNEDFVNDNLRFVTEPDGKIVPFAILGEENARLEQEIALLSKRLGISDNGRETGLYAERVKRNKAYIETHNEYINETNNRDSLLAKKATNREIGIKYQPDKFGNQNYNIANLKSDIENVLSEQYLKASDEKIKECEQVLTEKPLPKTPAVSIKSRQLSKVFQKAKDICARKLGQSGKLQELLLDIALNEWVHQGLDLHANKDQCVFCGNPITDERRKILHEHFDEESKNLEEEIENTIELIMKEKDTYENLCPVKTEQVYSCFHKELAQLNERFEEEKEQYKNKLDEIIGFLNKKKKHITQILPPDFSIDLSDEFDEIFNSYNELLSKSNQYGEQIPDKRKTAQEILRLAEVDKYLLSINYRTLIDKISSLDQKQKEAKRLFESIQSEIEEVEKLIIEKRNMQKSEELGVLKVNEYLQDFFGCNYLSLKAKETTTDGEIQVFFFVERNGECAYHLSEGERSLISFCYFIAKLEDNETLGKKPIIWIDDPISSLDGNHIYFVFSLLQMTILKKGLYEQLFITTHNLLFLKYLHRIGKNANTQYFLIERKGDISSIKSMPNYLKEHGTEFNYWFATIYQCAQQDGVTDENKYLFEGFGNNARKFFETYLYYRYPNEEPPKEKMKKFFGDDVIPSILLSKICDEQSHAEGDLENHSIPFEWPEIISAAKCIIKKLEATDKEQYEALIESVDK